MNHLLYGHNTDPRIVAVHQKDDTTMRVYFREEDRIRHEDAQFFPFFFLEDDRYMDGFTRKHWVKRLDGTSFYQHLCVFEEWGAMWEAVRFVLDNFNRKAVNKVESYHELDALFLYPDPVAQYLMQSGRTLFKEMAFEELYRLQLDIETYASGPRRFSNASRPGDRIILIALSDNRGWKHLIDGKKLNEREMLEELLHTIKEKDPDVIEGHNIYNFDLPYILRRSELHDLSLTIGRDGSAPRSFDTRTSFAERSFEYTLVDIAGRHVVDTLILVQSYDTVKRNMESHGLKYAAQYFGFAEPNRTYIKGDKISWHWDHDVKPLMDYALDDVDETRHLSEHLSISSFYLAQMLPFNYSQVVRMGSAGKIESLLVREYLREKHAIPKPSDGAQTTGGYTDVFLTGVAGPILHADVESLYPSIMINKGVSPATDVRNVFGRLLKDLTSMRLNAKRKLKSVKDPDELSRLDAMQSSFKILINSFYGYLGYSRGLFNDFAQADVVTRTGQEMLRQMIASIESAGGTVVEVDTDGIFFVPPPDVRGEQEEERFVDQLSRQMPAGITVALSGRYRKILSYKMKNYALLDYENRLQVKGSSLISRSMERFGRDYIRQCIERIFNADIAGLHKLYVDFCNKILNHQLEPRDFGRSESIKDTLADYTRDVESGRRNRSAAYEVAAATARAFKPGDRVTYYITGTDPNPRSFENCKPVEDWDPNFPDENTQFYLKRLDEFSEKFAPFFLPKDFRAVYSQDDLFPFDPAGIELLTAAVRDSEEGTEARVPADAAAQSDEL